MSKIVSFLVILVALFSCSEETFTVKKNQETSTSTTLSINSNQSCSSVTRIKPEVDFLFLWDNSESTYFINSSTKAALNNTLNLISENFNYHILIAPLLLNNGDSTNKEIKLISSDEVGLSSSAKNVRIDQTYATSTGLSFSVVQGSKEEGLQRAVNLIKSNISNGIFRQNAYLNIVVMSNDDDTTWYKYPFSEGDINRSPYYHETKVHELLCLRGNYSPPAGKSCSGQTLNNAMMRFMSIAAFNQPGTSSCSAIGQGTRNRSYIKASSMIYSTPYTNGAFHTDQALRSDIVYDPVLNVYTFDSYDICRTSSFSQIFDGINSSIQETLIKHEYDYWPVASAGALNIDPDEITVLKDNTTIPRLNEPVSGDPTGFTFTPQVYNNQNTRFSPTPGEPYTGYLVKLYGNAKVKYPECMTVQTQAPKEFFGYLNLATKPLESSIQLRINGNTISKSSTDGWQLIKDNSGNPKYFDSKNIKIRTDKAFCGSSDYCTGSPAEIRSGYMLQLYGSAIYSNGAQIELIYDPSS